MPQKTGDFEFRLGRFGLIFITLVIALLFLFFFVCGVMVGKNIDSYPKKITRDIPGAIKQRFVKSGVIPTDTDKDKSDDFEFTFYDKLKGKHKDIKKTSTARMKEKPSTRSKPHERKQPGGKYVIQIASFRDKSRTKVLQAKLSDMGYSSTVDEINLPSSGKMVPRKFARDCDT